jgi:hypothetical protein
MNNILWHYMPQHALELAENDGFLSIPSLMYDSELNHPAVWFTCEDLRSVGGNLLRNQGYSQVWDKRRTGAPQLLPLARVGIRFDTFLLTWKEYCPLVFPDQRKVGKLALELFGETTTSNWFGSLGPIPIDHWHSVQIRTDEGWRNADERANPKVSAEASAEEPASTQV